MSLQDFNPEWIEELNRVGNQLRDVTVRIPTEEELQQAKQEIENILPPPNGNPIMMSYVRNVLFALEYAQTHFSDIMLDDIKNGVKVDVADYKGVGTK